MPAVATHADALELSLSSVEIVHLTAVGTVSGIRILFVAARNGVGMGRIRNNGSLASWQAPGSSTWGDWAEVGTDGNYILEDGEDRDKYVRVAVLNAYLSAGFNEQRVVLQDVYDNAVSHDDVTAGEATAGDVTTHNVIMTNVSTMGLSDLRVWLDAAVAGMEINDGSGWVSPTTESAALVFGALAPAATDTLQLRRTIGAAAPSDPDVLNHLHFSWNGL